MSVSFETYSGNEISDCLYRTYIGMIQTCHHVHVSARACNCFKFKAVVLQNCFLIIKKHALFQSICNRNAKFRNDSLKTEAELAYLY